MVDFIVKASATIFLLAFFGALAIVPACDAAANKPYLKSKGSSDSMDMSCEHYWQCRNEAGDNGMCGTCKMRSHR